MPPARFTVYEDETALPTITTDIMPTGYAAEPVLGQRFHIPQFGPVPAYLDEHHPAVAAPAPHEDTITAALRNAKPFWPPWRGRDCVDKGRRDAEMRITELRQGGGRGVEEEMGWEEEVVLEMEEDEGVARGKRRTGRGTRIWRWVKRRLGFGRK